MKREAPIQKTIELALADLQGHFHSIHHQDAFVEAATGRLEEFLVSFLYEECLVKNNDEGAIESLMALLGKSIPSR